MLALSLLLRPMLSSLGEIHEFAHNASGQHLDIPPLTGAGDEQQEDQEAGTLHTLLHFAHCCGNASAAFPESMLGPVGLTIANRPLNDAYAAIPLARWQTPFRPPISA